MASLGLVGIFTISFLPHCPRESAPFHGRDFAWSPSMVPTSHVCFRFFLRGGTRGGWGDIGT